MSRFDVPGPSWSPWQRVYGAAHQLRHGYWRTRAARLPRPVISIGNLHWGGGGKTPLTAAVARHLRDRGRRVAILSRGYGRKGKGVTVVSHGGGPLLGPRQAGDEPVLLAADAPGVAVVVAADRALAGRHALHRLDPAPDLFLLDDGFSHLKLRRDLDLLVFPSADPVGGGRLWPGGRLREPMASASRADALLVTGLDAGPEDAAQLARSLGRYGFDGPGFAAPTRVGEPRAVAPPASRALDGEMPVLLVSAIARPESFRRSAETAGLDVAGHLAFRDHDPFGDRALAEIRRGYEEYGVAALVVTSKDRVKLQGRIELPMYELPISAVPEPAFFDWLDQRVGELVAKART